MGRAFQATSLEPFRAYRLELNLQPRSVLAHDAQAHVWLVWACRQCPEALPKEDTSAPIPTRHTLWSVLHSTCLRRSGCKGRLGVAD